MTPSLACATFIKGFEKCRLTAYKPTPWDVWTIGWGATGKEIVKGLTWTQEQADDRFEADLVRFAKGAWANISGTTTQGQFDAMVSLAFNIGLGNFSTSTLLKLHNAGDHLGASAQFVRWNKQKGIVLKGLATRRKAEAEMYDG